MHIVTKFLVVFAAVLAMLLSGLTIAYSSNSRSLRSAVQLAENRANQAQAQAAAVTTASAGERESLGTKISDLESGLQQATNRLADLQGENAKLLADVNRMSLASQTHSSQIDQFTAVVQTYAALNKVQTEELETLRRKELDYARREIELADRINDLTGELEVSRETGRSLQEQLVATRESLDRVEQGGAGASSPTGSADATIRAPENFRSQITSVRDDPSGNTIISIPAGASDGLRERMKLNIVRDNSFLASLILERVDQNEAVGRVDYLGRKGEVQIRQGDRVIASTL